MAEMCPIGEKYTFYGLKNPCDPSIGIRGCVLFGEALRQARSTVGTESNQFPTEDDRRHSIGGYVEYAIHNKCLFGDNPEMTVEYISDLGREGLE